MFNKQTFYSINKADPNSIVYLDSEGHLLRLTRQKNSVAGRNGPMNSTIRWKMQITSISTTPFLWKIFRH